MNTMRNFGLVGYPLSHSFSKKYFTEKFAAEDIIDCKYELYPLPDISKFPSILKENKLQGVNVTIPYKKAVLPYLDYLSDEVKAMEACNCILVDGDRTCGYNTDTIGFENTFKPQLKPHHNKALILGTGGASSAVAFVLHKLSIDYLFVSRGKSDRNNSITYNDLDSSIISQYQIIINTTPLGTTPDVDVCPNIPYEALTSRHFLYDLIYNPSETLFLKKGKQQGASIENGGQMLVIQAEESWRIWNGITA